MIELKLSFTMGIVEILYFFSCPQGQNRQTWCCALLFRAQPSTPGFGSPRRATLLDAGRAEEARHCGNKGILGLVIDAQIVVEQSDLERVRTANIRKYADNPDIERPIQRETGAIKIRHLPVILSWRGIWCKTSASDFLTLRTITRRDLAVIATRVLIGGIIAHRDFNLSTAVTFER